MDPQKFGDSYDFVKSVPRQLFLPRIASNQMLLNIGRTRSLGGASHEVELICQGAVPAPSLY